MEHYKIQLLTVLFLILHINVYAQNIAKSVIENLYDIDDDSTKSHLKGNKIFMLMTNKNCSNCFQQLCEHYKSKNINSVYLIVFTEKDYLSLLPIASRYKEAYSCVEKVFFYFVDNKMNTEMKNAIIDVPTPQLIIKQNDSVTHIPYNETLKLIH